MEPLSELRVPRGRQLRSAAEPPAFRGTDDLLANLSARAALDALRSPMGTLKECMDAATPAEQAFATRAVLASKNIQEWLDELLAWPWLSGGDSADLCTSLGRKLFQSVELIRVESDKHFGNLPAADIARYEARITEISRDLDNLDIEEIKSQVLHNHIMPLSRPGSPMLDTRRPMASLANYATMDDLTALIAATLLQALPTLSRLTRLMNTWGLRLLVLRKVPVFLDALADGENALRSGWNTINLSFKASGASGSPPVSTLSRKEFDVMKSILERKVAKSGRDLDVLLDLLEGSEDSLPEDWIDRVDALEREYGEWTVASERKIREATLSRARIQLRPQDQIHPVNMPIKSTMSNFAPGSPIKAPTRSMQESATFKPVSLRPKHVQHTPPGTEDIADSPVEFGSESEPSTGDFSQGLSEPSETLASLDTSLRLRDDSPPPVIKVLPPPPEKPSTRGVGGHDQGDAELDIPSARIEEPIDVFDGTAVDDDLDWPGPAGSVQRHREIDSAQFDLDFDFDEVVVPEPDLPLLPPRRSSDVSSSSTVVHGLPSGFAEFSSDQLEHGSPELPRMRDADLEAIPSDDLSLESSPRTFRSSTRSLSVSFNDMPTVAEIPGDESPRTPVQSSFMEYDLPRDPGSPGKTSISSSDDQLQQQISEILESVPAKIRLRAEPSAINLNPPDFTMPTRKAPKPDPYPRSQSSLSTMSNVSSRAGTPSFTLAPAYSRNNRNRHQRGNQEIKLYHLSRSNGEAPIKLFIRCVGERGERVMVRVGGGWADLGEYLKEYASHHGRRSGQSKVEIKDLPSAPGHAASTPPTRPQSAQESYSPVTPLHVRKSRRSAAVEDLAASSTFPKTPLASVARPDAPSSGDSTRSRSSSRLSWAEEDSSLGMAGPRAKQIEMSEESKAWVESVKERVRIASGERKVSDSATAAQALMDGKFGEIGKVGATKRLFRRQG